MLHGLQESTWLWSGGRSRTEEKAYPEPLLQVFEGKTLSSDMTQRQGRLNSLGPASVTNSVRLGTEWLAAWCPAIG